MTQPTLPELGNPQPRVYALNSRHRSEEEIAVTFAMTSRNPEPFDVIADKVTAARAQEFNERWVVGYGHASVAEHAVLHLAVENYSRVAVDRLEDNRLASYTEKSSRYQPMEPGSYHVPAELTNRPDLVTRFREAADRLMTAYETVTQICAAALKTNHSAEPGERARAFEARMKRQAMDSSRALLPAAVMTNVGLTANARTMEHAISKLLSAPLAEERDLGTRLKREALKISPTLVKYADESAYLKRDQNRAVQMTIGSAPDSKNGRENATVVRDDRQAEQRLAAAYLFHRNNTSYQAAHDASDAMSEEERAELIASYLAHMGDHDPGPRELEQISFTLELTMDYGALREFRRHRLQSLLPQIPTIALGANTPALVKEAGADRIFQEALEEAGKVHQAVTEHSPRAAAYLVTHAHLQRMITTLNLRECYHLFRLRTTPQAHPGIRRPIAMAQNRLASLHPALFQRATLD